MGQLMGFLPVLSLLLLALQIWTSDCKLVEYTGFAKSLPQISKLARKNPPKMQKGFKKHHQNEYDPLKKRRKDKGITKKKLRKYRHDRYDPGFDHNGK